MPRLPAFCESCGSVFASPLEAAGPGAENAFAIPVPCPACDGSGRVPGELLSLSVETARRFDEVDAEEADAFLDLLADAAAADRAPGEELLMETARRAPAFVEVARGLPAERPRVLGGVAALLRRVREEMDAAARGGAGDEAGGGAAGMAGAHTASRPAAAVREAVGRLLDEEAVEPDPTDEPEEVAAARRRLGEAGRNDPCPCGSGDKYKSCHWIPDLRTTRQ